MAQVAITKIAEGNAHIIIRVDLKSDGVTGELVNEVILSPSDLVPSRPNNRTAFRIMQAWYGLVWFDILLGYGTVSPQTIWTISKDCDSHIDFRSFGGLMDYATYPPGDVSGKLWISTNGFGTPGSTGTLILELRKTNEL